MSLTADGGQVAGASSSPSVSRDGSVVVWTSSDPDVVPGDTNAAMDVFVRDVQAGTTTRADVGYDGRQDLTAAAFPKVALSADGRHVAWRSSTPLVARDGGHTFDVFLRSAPLPDAPFDRR